MTEHDFYDTSIGLQKGPGKRKAALKKLNAGTPIKMSQGPYIFTSAKNVSDQEFIDLIENQDLKTISRNYDMQTQHQFPHAKIESRHGHLKLFFEDIKSMHKPFGVDEATRETLPVWMANKNGVDTIWKETLTAQFQYNSNTVESIVLEQSQPYEITNEENYVKGVLDNFFANYLVGFQSPSEFALHEGIIKQVKGSMIGIEADHPDPENLASLLQMNKGSDYKTLTVLFQDQPIQLSLQRGN